jgi:hypothetical protein
LATRRQVSFLYGLNDVLFFLAALFLTIVGGCLPLAPAGKGDLRAARDEPIEVRKNPVAKSWGCVERAERH